METNNFSSMQELVSYLSVLEDRIRSIETENRELKKVVNGFSREGLVTSHQGLDKLPNTNLLNLNFFPRAFAVWGHFFVSNLIIGLILSCIYFLIVSVLLGNVLGNIQF